jgi:hypothetical protein
MTVATVMKQAMMVVMVVMVETKASAQTTPKKTVCGLITACGPMLDVLITMALSVKTLTVWTSAMMVMKIG